jgi:5-methylcytosine-specific restriction enzyme subunit McrC
MSRRFGFPVPIAVEYDDFTVDIAENQLLAMATLRLLKVPRISASARLGLQRLRHTLNEVTVPPRGAQKPKWQPSRLNAHYQGALQLAEIVISAESFENLLGDLPVTGLLFDMCVIFEDFVTVTMSESLNRARWQCERQALLHLDDSTQGPDETRPAVRDRPAAGGSGRCQVQGGETRRIPQRRPLSDVGLLHCPRPHRWTPVVPSCGSGRF